MQSFPDTDGDDIANVPAYYAAPQGRKVIEDSTALIDLVKSPNKYSVIIVGIVILLLAIIIIVILLLVKLVKKIKFPTAS